MLGLDRALNDQLTLQSDYISGDDNFFTFGAAYNISSFSLSAAYLFSNTDFQEDGFTTSFGWQGNVSL